MSDAELLETLRAEREIQRVILRYAHGIDRCDFDKVRDCFHADARIDYGGLKAGPRDEVLDWLARSLPTLAGTTHFFGAPYIELDLEAGSADVETYSSNTTRQRPDPDGVIHATHIGARYVDRFTYREGAWRISERTLVRDWSNRTPENADPSVPSGAPR